MNDTDQKLRAFHDRLVRLHEERDGLTSDISDILNEAASAGFDKPALKAVVKRSLKDSAKDEAEQGMLVETYWTSIQDLAHAHGAAE